jgi:CBS domain-containing protein
MLKIRVMTQTQQTIRSVMKARAAPPPTCRAGDTVRTAVELLNRHKIGALPVTDGDGRLVGIISERDVIRGLAEKKDAVLASPVDSLMTREVATCTPSTGIEAAVLLMDARHIRHLPVVEAGRVIDMLSLRDVVAHRLAEAEIDADVLREVARASGGVSGV